MQVTFLSMAELFLLGLTLWLGAYLLELRSRKRTLSLTGVGLVVYAFALAITLLGGKELRGMWMLPGILWLGAALYLLPSEVPRRGIAIRAWWLVALPLWILTLVEPLLGILPLASMFLAALILLRRRSKSELGRGRAAVATVTLLLMLSTGMVVLPVRWLSTGWGLLLLGVDLLLLGLIVSWWDAFEQGHRVRQPLLRSLVSTVYSAGALVLLVMIAAFLDGGLTSGTQFLLVAVIAVGVLSQVFGERIQSLLDRLIFSQSSELTQQRELLRQVADRLSRKGGLDIEALSHEEFTRITRQALSDMDDLSKLAASPLTELDIVVDEAGDNPVERAHHLRQVLVEGIERLKPRSGEPFGVSDEWRYYNALYFPYVVGLKPYSRQPRQMELSDSEKRALEWIRSSVPERTLYNWQSTAAELVAKDIQSRERKTSSWQ